MQTDNFFDLVILGGGAAGLSLGLSIAAKNIPNQSCLIIEKRSEYTDDKTWGFWEFPGYPTYIYELIRSRWHSWDISDNNQRWNMRSSAHPYCAISAKSFYHYAKTEIKKSDKVTLSMGCEVFEVKKHAHSFQLKTSQGKITAGQVVDTTPRKSLTFPGHAMFQAFYGIEFQLSKPMNELLNTERASLMTELRQTSDGLAFHYVLPYKKDTALFEYTLFSPKHLNPASLQTECQKHLASHLKGSPYTVLREEYGLLPMAVSSKNTEQNGTVAGGARGGAIRAASGYAFSNIQFWAAKSAERFSKGKPIKPYKQSKTIRFLDSIFLGVLKANPKQNVSIFTRMGARLSGDVFARFLSQKAKAIDLIKIIVSMPKLIFIKQLLRALFARSNP